VSRPARARVVEVGPRDGLQNEKTLVPTERKLALIERLADAGLGEIEATAFVHPKWIPALADAEAVLAGRPSRPGLRYAALIPNLRGYERAISGARPDEVVLVCSASEGHNRANLNRSTAESLAELARVAARARADGLGVRGAISTSFWCPFDGRTPEARALEVARAYADMGVDEVVLADTLGQADPSHVAALAAEAMARLPVPVGLHLHDTHGMALAAVYAALEVGVTTFDAAIGGLGGCPYCPGAAGNLATEDLVYMLHRLGIATGVDESKLLVAARFAAELVGRPLASRQLIANAGAA
jgi:hydroxymethylglutaryl-CoA lyase